MESTQQSDRQEAGNTGRLVSQPECTNKEKKKKGGVHYSSNWLVFKKLFLALGQKTLNETLSIHIYTFLKSYLTCLKSPL